MFGRGNARPSSCRGRAPARTARRAPPPGRDNPRGGASHAARSRAEPGSEESRMQIIPVLDLMGGRVVRGVAGRRSEYRALTSALTASSKPLDVARAFRLHFGLATLYVADLDAI